MRALRQVLLVAGLGAAFPAAQAPPRTEDAGRVLAAAREALGGESRLAAVRNFVATGHTRQVRGDSLVPIEFEILCELPDRYLRKDEIPAQESGPTTLGFNGEELIQLPLAAIPPAGRDGQPGGPPPAQLEMMRKARVTGVKQDFVRLTLGLFAGSFTSAPLTFTYVGQAEAPQGKAEVIDVKGAGGFAGRLFVSSQTHLPIMLSWQPSSPQSGGRAAPPSAAGPIEFRMYYADYREVDGLQWPFRIRRASGADTTEETTFDRFKINTRIDPKRFEGRK
jgi:hypothetical protein